MAKPRLGRSKDYNQSKREHIHSTYYEYVGKLSMLEIAEKLGYKNSINMYSMKKSNWWKELDEKQARSQGV